MAIETLRSLHHATLPNFSFEAERRVRSRNSTTEYHRRFNVNDSDVSMAYRPQSTIHTCADFKPNGPVIVLNVFELLLFDTAIEDGVLYADEATPLVVFRDVVIRRRRR